VHLHAGTVALADGRDPAYGGYVDISV